MASSLPFLVSETNYTLFCPIDDEQYRFDVRWNSRDEGWYLDMYASDGTAVALNVKVVLGVNLGRRSLHRFFDNHKIMVIDSSGEGIDPGFDDLNSRVLVVITSPSDAA